MPGLSDLRAAIAELKQSAKSGRVYFYAAGDHSGQLKHGYFSIDAGRTCVIDYAKKGNDEALAEIAGMSFLKIVFMPVDGGQVVSATNPALAIDELLGKLTPATAATASASIVEVPVTAAPAAPAHQHDGIADLHQLALERDAVAILENFYGSAAEKKVAEVAAQFPPIHKPIHFLNNCKQLLAMMVGADKANQLFGPLYDKISQ